MDGWIEDGRTDRETGRDIVREIGREIVLGREIGI